MADDIEVSDFDVYSSFTWWTYTNDFCYRTSKRWI
jgi:hypothetical protein